MGECGLLAGAPFRESSRPLGSSLGLLVALGFSLAADTPLMELLGGGDGDLDFTGEGSGEKRRQRSDRRDRSSTG